jgi:hypothetical protein
MDKLKISKYSFVIFHRHRMTGFGTNSFESLEARFVVVSLFLFASAASLRD